METTKNYRFSTIVTEIVMVLLGLYSWFRFTSCS